MGVNNGVMGRYVRQETVFGTESQRKFGSSKVIIVGVGALGSVEAELLVRAGVGSVALIDNDLVELSNLQRQSLYTEDDIGLPKVEAAADRLRAINKDVEVISINAYLSLSNINLLDDADIILDGTDNMASRFLINEYAVKNGVPAVFASAVHDKGLVMVVSGSPCYNCVFGNRSSVDDCESSGVINGVTHIIGSLAASEALKLIAGFKPLNGLFSCSLLSPRFDLFSVSVNPDCSVCQGEYPLLQGGAFVRFCSRKGCFVVENSGLDEGDHLIGGFRVSVDNRGSASFFGVKNKDDVLRLLNAPGRARSGR